MPEQHPRLIEHLLETLSLAVSCETQNPPNPVTRAALQHSAQDLMAALHAIDNQFQPEQGKLVHSSG